MRDAIDFGAVSILNSPDVRDWPATATITRLELRPTGVHVEFSKRDGPGSWPDVPFITVGEPLQYTLWIVLQIDGQWFTSGCIQFWRGLDESGGPPNLYAQNWYYDARRWAPMTGHQPAPGEPVGFLVTAGDARNNGTAVVHERSQVVVVSFPSADGSVFTFSEDDQPKLPADHQVSAGLDEAVHELLTVTMKLIEAYASNTAATLKLSDELEQIRAAGIKVHP